MGRCRTKESIDNQIKQLTEKIERTQKRLKDMEKELKFLIAEKDNVEAKSLYAAFKQSNKTYEQTITFFGVPVRKKKATDKTDSPSIN